MSVARRRLEGREESPPAVATQPALAPPLRAWPALVLLYGIPAFWALGLASFYLPVAALLLGALLLRQQSLVLVPGILPFVAFLMWTMACAVMIDTPGRLVGYGLRFGQYAAIALLMIYIVNARSLTARKILDALTAYWVFVIVGGYLGMLWPDTRLTATVGRLLPAQLLANDYISDLAFPPFAEVQTPFGAIEPFLRPSAPFAYANGWGAAMAFLTPVAIGAALYRGTRQSLMLTLLALAAALPPAVVTSNRGMYIALVVGTSYLLLRLLMTGRWRSLHPSDSEPPESWPCSSRLGSTTRSRPGRMWSTRARAAQTCIGRRWNGPWTHRYWATGLHARLSPARSRPGPKAPSGTRCSVSDSLGLPSSSSSSSAPRSGPPECQLWRACGCTPALVTAVVMSLYYGLDRLLLPFAFVTALLLRERETGRSRLWPTPKPP